RGLYDLAWVARMLDWAEDASLSSAGRATFLASSALALDPIVARGGHAEPHGREAIAQLASRQQTAHDRLLGALGETGIRVVDWSALGPGARAELRELYCKELFPLVMPQASGPAHPFPRVSSLSLNLLVAYRAGRVRPLEYARIKVPRTHSASRFLAVPSAPASWVPIESIIAGNLDLLLPGARVEACTAFRPTRSSRPGVACHGPIVRLEVAPERPEVLCAALARILHFDASRIETAGFLGVEDWETVADALPRR
ncbi:MAG: hypothetical protein HKP30_05355, partial [Myxococcales bacterium]|nr:hypothetical protein [Myxococcales bacterium]